MRFEWTPLMGSVSGKGGQTEEACQAMVRACVAWLEANPRSKPVFHELNSPEALIVSRNVAAGDLMGNTAAAGWDILGKDLMPTWMLKVSLQHGLAIARLGWTEYERQAFQVGPRRRCACGKPVAPGSSNNTQCGACFAQDLAALDGGLA